MKNLIVTILFSVATIISLHFIYLQEIEKKMLKWRHYIITINNGNKSDEFGYTTVYTKNHKQFYDDFKRLYHCRYGYYPNIISAYIDYDDVELFGKEI